MKVIFQDIDGPLIPGRMYFAGGRIMNADKTAFIYGIELGNDANLSTI